MAVTNRASRDFLYSTEYCENNFGNVGEVPSETDEKEFGGRVL